MMSSDTTLYTVLPFDKNVLPKEEQCQHIPSADTQITMAIQSSLKKLWFSMSLNPDLSLQIVLASLDSADDKRLYELRRNDPTCWQKWGRFELSRRYPQSSSPVYRI